MKVYTANYMNSLLRYRMFVEIIFEEDEENENGKEFEWKMGWWITQWLYLKWKSQMFYRRQDSKTFNELSMYLLSLSLKVDIKLCT